MSKSEERFIEVTKYILEEMSRIEIGYPYLTEKGEEKKAFNSMSLDDAYTCGKYMMCKLIIRAINREK